MAEVFDAASLIGISYEDVVDRDDGDVYRLLFPDRYRNENVFEEPDWEHVHKELGRTGVTLQMLHGKYVDGCRESENVCMSYPTFCRRYRDFTTTQNIASLIDHKAGRSVEADWSGPTMSLVDPQTGEVSKVYCLLPRSRSAVMTMWSQPST